MAIPITYKDRLLYLMSELEDETKNKYRIILIDLKTNKEFNLDSTYFTPIIVQNSTKELNGPYKSFQHLYARGRSLGLNLFCYHIFDDWQIIFKRLWQ
jgi:hypothetical protein